MRLTEGVHSLPLSYEFEARDLEIHPAAVETDRGVILVDAGLPDSTAKIREALSAADLALADVRYVLLTHQDGDHVGGCRAVLAETDATTLAHRTAAPYVEGERAPAKGDPDDRPPAVPVDVELVGGVRFRTRAGPMEVIETPGHTPGHVSLYFPEAGLLLAADATVAADGDLQGPSEQHSLDVETALESFAHLGTLDADATLCYHGGYVEAGSDRIAELHAELTGE
jgi:glyoxylase-like metal-dependent hydrolase (beta-lactamase superfamily II)